MPTESSRPAPVLAALLGVPDTTLTLGLRLAVRPLGRLTDRILVPETVSGDAGRTIALRRGLAEADRLLAQLEADLGEDLPTWLATPHPDLAGICPRDAIIAGEGAAVAAVHALAHAKGATQ